MSETGELAKTALRRLPKPYSDRVTLHVFCEIERTPELREKYDDLVAKMDSVNREIGRTVAGALGTKGTGKKIQARKRGLCEIVGSVSKLDVASINHDWK